MVEIADGPDEWDKARSLSERYPGTIWWAGGLHPYHSDQSSPALWSALEKMAADPRFVAVGEIGLDYAKCPVPRERQIQTFEEGLDLASRLRKPAIIHCRDAYQDLMPILRRRSEFGAAVRSVVHCFSGNADEARELTRMGFFLGVDGPVTYPSAGPLREALAAVPIESLVVETDSPYLPPQSRRGQRNEPICLLEIATRLANHKGREAAAVAAILMENSLRLFQLKPA